MNEEEYIAEFSYDKKPLYYRVILDRKGKIIRSTKLNSKPDLNNYTSTSDMYDEIGMEFINFGLVLLNLWKSNDDTEENLLELLKRITNRR